MNMEMIYDELLALRKEISDLKRSLTIIPPFLSVTQAARALGVHRSTIIRSIEDGRISPVPGKRPYLIPSDQLSIRFR